MKKQFLAVLLALCTVLLLLSPSAFAAESTSNFKTVNTYRDGQFTDVASGVWYADGVKSSYELGLMTGTSDSLFDPNGNVTLAQAVTMAARLHSIYHTGSENFQQDVSASHANAQEIYQLYRAGVLTGSGDTLSFNPSASIRRSEAAAIVTRMALPEQRVKFTEDAEYTWQGDSSLDFTAQKMDGSNFTLSDQAGKVVFVNFWATWCGPCVREMPDIDKLYKEYGADGEVEFVLINCGENSSTVQAFLDKKGFSVPVICDGDRTIAGAYSITAIPRTVIFGKDGNILNDFTGTQSYKTFKSAIDSALEG